MSLSKKAIEEYKRISELKEGREISRQEAEDGAYSLVNFVSLIHELAVKDLKRREKLKSSPDRFRLDDGTYNCKICYASISNETCWYSKFGITCLLCYQAFKNNILPESATEDRDSWYGMYDLKDMYGIHPSTARTLIREGKLRARIVMTDKGTPYFYVFLKSENEQFLKRYSGKAKT